MKYNQEFTSEEIEEFENEIMQELFSKNLKQLEEYYFSFLAIYCDKCKQEQIIEVQVHICETYLPQMKLYYEYYDFVNNSEKAQEYLQKIEELHN
ncbi:24595_t:CDS:1, partial [Gigaspora rosea]